MTDFRMIELLKCESGEEEDCGICFSCEYKGRLKQREERENRDRRKEEETHKATRERQEEWELRKILQDD